LRNFASHDVWVVPRSATARVPWDLNMPVGCTTTQPGGAERYFEFKYWFMGTLTRSFDVD